MVMRLCEIDGCENKHYGSGLCSKHYTRQRRYGDVNEIKLRRQIDGQTYCIICKQYKDEINFSPKGKNRSSWCKDCRNSYQKEKRLNDDAWREKQDRASRNSNYKCTYGITIKEYEDILDHQGGVCKICGGVDDNKRLAIDHNHITGDIRGLLCSFCNKALGLFRDDIELVEKAASYLKASVVE